MCNLEIPKNLRTSIYDSREEEEVSLYRAFFFFFFPHTFPLNL